MLSNEWVIEEVRDDIVIARHHAQVIQFRREDIDSDEVPQPGQRVLENDKGGYDLVGAAKRASDLETTRALPSAPEKPEEFAE